MSRRYTEEEKLKALEHLNANAGNVTRTAAQTSIPARTLREWKREYEALVAADGLSHTPDFPSEGAAAAENLRRRRQQEGEYTHIRQMLMDHLFDLTESLMDNPDTAHLRINALSRLLDRVIQLEKLSEWEQKEIQEERRSAEREMKMRLRREIERQESREHEPLQKATL
jgi:transposase-like protein